MLMFWFVISDATSFEVMVTVIRHDFSVVAIVCLLGLNLGLGFLNIGFTV